MILPTDVENLSILPAGKPRHNATELLSSDAMEQVIETLEHVGSRQIIIFDSPPLLQTTESKILASLLGQVVVVVRAEVTAQDAVTAAISTLDEGKAVNLVLNQVRSGFGESMYGYGYGYGHGNIESASSKTVETTQRGGGGMQDG